MNIDRITTILAIGIAFAAIALYLFDAPINHDPIPQRMSVGDGPYKALVVGANRMGVVKGFDSPQQCEQWVTTFKGKPGREWLDGVICFDKLKAVTTGDMVLPELQR